MALKYVCDICEGPIERSEDRIIIVMYKEEGETEPGPGSDVNFHFVGKTNYIPSRELCINCAEKIKKFVAELQCG
jgi:hypothetical protein